MTGIDTGERPEAFPSNAEEEGRGLFRLSQLQLYVLRRLRENLQEDATAEELGLSGRDLTTQIAQMLTSIGARDRAELLSLMDRL